MRIQFLFRALAPKSGRPNKHAIQGLIYKSLQETPYEHLHDNKGSKPFTFSDWFALKNGATFHLSSSDENIVDTIYSYFNEKQGLQFLDYSLEHVEKYEVKPTRLLRTGSPIILSEKNDQYLSFKRKTLTVEKFDQLIREKLVKRYRDYSQEEDFVIEQPLFEELELRKEIPVPVKMGGREFLIIGSTWNKLVLRKDPTLKEFYSWMMEEGIGEKRSLGFGYLQPYRLGGKKK